MPVLSTVKPHHHTKQKKTDFRARGPLRRQKGSHHRWERLRSPERTGSLNIGALMVAGLGPECCVAWILAVPSVCSWAGYPSCEPMPPMPWRCSYSPPLGCSEDEAGHVVGPAWGLLSPVHRPPPRDPKTRLTLLPHPRTRSSSPYLLPTLPSPLGSIPLGVDMSMSPSQQVSCSRTGHKSRAG